MNSSESPTRGRTVADIQPKKRRSAVLSASVVFQPLVVVLVRRELRHSGELLSKAHLLRFEVGIIELLLQYVIHLASTGVGGGLLSCVLANARKSTLEVSSIGLYVSEQGTCQRRSIQQLSVVAAWFDSDTCDSRAALTCEGRAA